MVHTEVPCSLWGCRLYHGNLPSISPFGCKRLVVPPSHVLESRDDFLVPLLPADRPSQIAPSMGGNTHIEMAYIRHAHIATPVRPGLEKWRLRNNPIVQLDEQGQLDYRLVNERTWIYILTPYHVSIPSRPVLTTVDPWKAPFRRTRVVKYKEARLAVEELVKLHLWL
jgi:hypothetical protein